MQKVAIVGAGQSGLQLGIGLIKNGYQVSIFSDRSAEQIANGAVLSSPALFHSSLENERALGLHLWDELCPRNNHVTFTLGDDNSKLLSWSGKTENYYQAIDQRVKIPAWINLFKQLGGEFILGAIDSLIQLEEIANDHHLVVIATGKSSLNQLFEVDTQKITFTKPQRTLALTYVENVIPEKNSGVRFNAIPGIGEFFTMPGLTKSGHCEMMLFEGIPNGPFDCWKNINSAKEQLKLAIKLLKKYVPWEADRFKLARLTDSKAVLRGAYTPTVRKPTFQLPSGKFILGMGDAVVLNDPISGQGANCANKCAAIYLNSIIDCNTYTQAWMQETFNKYWAYAKWVTQWTNILLSEPKPHVIKLMQAASEKEPLSNYLANLFDHPPYLFPWIEDEVLTQKIINTPPNNPLTKPFLLQKKQLVNKKKNSIENILSINKKFVREFKKNSGLMKFIRGNEVKARKSREKFLAAIQAFSDQFQNSVMLRRIFTQGRESSVVAQIHLEEEFNHNKELKQDRGNQSAIWDPELEAATSWFNWKMFSLNDAAKTLLMHLVLEASANVFFYEANKVMKLFHETSYFSKHADLDEEHEQMGINLLIGLTDKEYEELAEIQQQGWKMLNLACNRIAKIAITKSHCDNRSKLPHYKANKFSKPTKLPSSQLVT